MLTGIVTNPKTASLRVNAHLGSLGTHALNINIGVPKTPLFTTTIPTGLEDRFEVKVADTKISRLVQLTRMKVDSSEGAVTISGNIKLLDPQLSSQHVAIPTRRIDRGFGPVLAAAR